MELKRGKVKEVIEFVKLLIVPYGIETVIIKAVMSHVWSF